MVTHGEVDKLRCIRAPAESVLSVYLSIPLDPAELRSLSARATDLIMAACGTSPDGRPGSFDPADEQMVRAAVAAHARQHLGRTIAIFACADLGLLEVVPLPGQFAERAVLAVRPHVRPLLAALQRHPDHRIAVVDGRHAYLVAVAEDRVETIASVPGGLVPRHGPSGWYGLEPHQTEQRMTGLTRHLFGDAAAILQRAARDSGRQPLVIGGHPEGISRLLADLSPELRDSYAGCFGADPQTLTPTRACELAAPVIADWTERRESRQASKITAAPSGVRAAVGLSACLAAVNADAVRLLLLPDSGVRPGYRCERCGTLGVTDSECCDWGAAARAVPDLLEEMALQTMHDGGDVMSLREAPFDVAAGLR